MKRRFATIIAVFGLLMLVPLVIATPGRAAVPVGISEAEQQVGSTVELRPVEAGAKAGYRNPLLPIGDFIDY